ncbi:MAG: acetylxylan esterase [Bryobacteraceae bacterium]
MKLALLFLAPYLAYAAGPWNFDQLSQTPKVYEAQTQEPGVRALYFESVAWRAKPTRVFAYYGAPAGKKLPAMVLIHGGGGTAFAEWVRLWNRRGYAAIAIDTCGNLPEKASADKPWSPPKAHHEYGGPEGWGGFAQIDEPVTDQWSYHAVAAAVLAHSLLRSFPEVDPKRTGVTGISWGGYLTDIVAGVDPRFRFAAPVYGCGFLGEDSAWLKNFADMGEERKQKWLSLWDPSVYLPESKVPMLWVTGTNDFAYPFPSLQKSYRLPKGPRTLSIRVRMRHGHADGAAPEEILAFADSILNKRSPLPRITKTSPGEVRFQAKRTIAKAELNYTKDEGRWQDRKWETEPAELDAKAHSAHAVIPEGTKVWYINLVDDKGLVVSSEHQGR